jgi:hypothetical protein
MSLSGYVFLRNKDLDLNIDFVEETAGNAGKPQFVKKQVICSNFSGCAWLELLNLSKNI